MYGIMNCVIVYAYPAETWKFTNLFVECLLWVYREDTIPNLS